MKADAQSRRFVDTNVLVYAVDAGEPHKRQRAIELLSALAGRLVLSSQVLGEFYVTVTRKLVQPVTPLDAARRVAELAQLEVVPLDAPLVRSAVQLSQQAQLSYWDAAIVAAAARSGCSALLTEDLRHGASISGVRIENPFA